MGEKPEEFLETYYDGQCPMCASIMDHVRASEQAGQFRLQDMHVTAKLPFDKDAIGKEIHVRDRDGIVYRGADAIFKIAEQFPKLKSAAKFARTPPARMAAPLVYRFVSANRRFLWGPGARLYWLKAAILITLCTELVMSAPLWIGPRTFPTVPVWPGLPALPQAVAYVMFGSAFLLSALGLISAKPRKFIGALLGVMAVFCVCDQTRLQAWIFQFAFLLGALTVFSWDGRDDAGRKRALSTARLIIAATYIYSGLQKLNFNFINNDFPWITQPITNALPQSASLLHVFGMTVPFLQVAFGVGLLVPRLRRVSLILAILMHVFILAMFGPFGQDWNAIIWPWTAAMAVFDLLLFGGRTKVQMREILWPSGGAKPYHVAMLVLFGALPIASFFNAWDSALSAALYSGNLTEGIIYLDDEGAAALPPGIARYAVRTSANTHVINIQRWTIEEMNVVPYSESRIFKSVARSVCAYMPSASDLVLNVREQRLFLSNPDADYSCVDLRNG